MDAQLNERRPTDLDWALMRVLVGVGMFVGFLGGVFVGIWIGVLA